jgi:hypothetical protein
MKHGYSGVVNIPPFACLIGRIPLAIPFFLPALTNSGLSGAFHRFVFPPIAGLSSETAGGDCAQPLDFMACSP